MRRTKTCHKRRWSPSWCRNCLFTDGSAVERHHNRTCISHLLFPARLFSSNDCPLHLWMGELNWRPCAVPSAFLAPSDAFLSTSSRSKTRKEGACEPSNSSKSLPEDLRREKGLGSLIGMKSTWNAQASVPVHADAILPQSG